MAEIGAAEDPPCSAQNVHQMVKRVLVARTSETLEQARHLDLMRCDQLLAAIWQNALNGDIACIDRCLAIMVRRARLLGLDIQPSLRFSDHDMEVDESGRPIVKVEIVGDPEAKRVQWLEGRSERLRELEAAGAIIPTDRVVN